MEQKKKSKFQPIYDEDRLVARSLEIYETSVWANELTVIRHNLRKQGKYPTDQTEQLRIIYDSRVNLLKIPEYNLLHTLARSTDPADVSKRKALLQILHYYGYDPIHKDVCIPGEHVHDPGVPKYEPCIEGLKAAFRMLDETGKNTTPPAPLIRKPTYKDRYELIDIRNYPPINDSQDLSRTIEVRKLAEYEDFEAIAEYCLKYAEGKGYVIPPEIDGVSMFLAMKADQLYHLGQRDISLQAFYHFCGFNGKLSRESEEHLLALIDKNRFIEIRRMLYLLNRKTKKRKEWSEATEEETSWYDVGPIEVKTCTESFMFLPITSWYKHPVTGTTMLHIGDQNRLFAIARERNNTTKQHTEAFNLGIRLDNDRAYSMNENIDRLFCMHKEGALKQDRFSIPNLFEKCPDCGRYSRAIDDMVKLLDHRKQHGELYDYLIDCKNDCYYLFWSARHKSRLKKKYGLAMKRGQTVIRKRERKSKPKQKKQKKTA